MRSNVITNNLAAFPTGFQTKWPHHFVCMVPLGLCCHFHVSFGHLNWKTAWKPKTTVKVILAVQRARTIVFKKLEKISVGRNWFHTKYILKSCKDLTELSWIKMPGPGEHLVLQTPVFCWQLYAVLFYIYFMSLPLQFQFSYLVFIATHHDTILWHNFPDLLITPFPPTFTFRIFKFTLALITSFPSSVISCYVLFSFYSHPHVPSLITSLK